LSTIQGRIVGAIESKQVDDIATEVDHVKKSLQEVSADPELKPLAEEVSRALVSVQAEGKKFASKASDIETRQRLATKIKLLEKVIQELADK